MQETWKNVVGYEGLYRVSDKGNVQSLYGKGKLIAPKKNCKGYLWYALYKNGAPKPLLAHRIVSEAFIPNPDALPQVNHKDENPINNSVENLEWCTASYNIRYYFQRHRYDRKPCHRKGRKRGVSYKPTQKIEQRALNGLYVKTWDTFAQIKYALNKNESSIRDCCAGKRNKAYGYLWTFVHDDMLRENAG